MRLWEKNRVVTSYVASAGGPDDAHIQYFHCRQSPTTTGLPGTDYDSAINAQICCGGVPGCAGGYVSGHMRTRLSLAIGSRKSFRGFPSQTYVIL